MNFTQARLDLGACALDIGGTGVLFFERRQLISCSFNQRFLDIEISFASFDPREVPKPNTVKIGRVHIRFIVAMKPLPIGARLAKQPFRRHEIAAPQLRLTEQILSAGKVSQIVSRIGIFAHQRQPQHKQMPKCIVRDINIVRIIRFDAYSIECDSKGATVGFISRKPIDPLGRRSPSCHEVLH
ncbi:protein of unknown function [Hyphomicrobium sp. 1Nfss2.1]